MKKKLLLGLSTAIFGWVCLSLTVLGGGTINSTISSPWSSSVPIGTSTDQLTSTNFNTQTILETTSSGNGNGVTIIATNTASPGWNVYTTGAGSINAGQASINSTNGAIQLTGPTGIGIQANSVFKTAGGYRQTIVTKTTNYTLTYNDQVVIASSASVVLTLPSAASVSGTTFTCKYTASGGSGVVTNSNGSQTIDGHPAYTNSTQNSCVTVVSDGSNWQITHKF